MGAKKLLVLAAAFIFAPSAIGGATTFDAYAGPNTWGPWYEVGGHVGSIGYSIDYTAVGKTAVVAEVAYVDQRGELVTKGFFGSTSFTTGPFVGAPRVRFKGTPFGSAVKVRVQP